MGKHFEVKHTRKGMKTLIRKIIWMQAYYCACGIHKQEGRQWVQSGSNKKKIKLASLAHLLEQTTRWTQSKTVVLENSQGEKTVIKAGTKLKREGRVFISLNKIPEIWNKLREFYVSLILENIRSKDRKYKLASKRIFDKIGEFVKNQQKDRIYSLETKPNEPLTEWEKGFNFPLFRTGKLVNSIRNKTISTANGKAQRDENKLKYLIQIDKFIKQINGRW